MSEFTEGTDIKMPTTMRIKHSDLPGMEKMAPGDKLKLIVHGHVHSNRAKDKFGDGETELDIHHIEHMDKIKDKKNASTMRMDELKNKIKDMSEKDEDMEGHSEHGISEDAD